MQNDFFEGIACIPARFSAISRYKTVIDDDGTLGFSSKTMRAVRDETPMATC